MEDVAGYPLRRKGKAMAASEGGETWKHGEARANGIRIHYVRAGGGTNASGPPLFLLHGWPEFWRIWRKLIPRLADRFDVIAPDLRGFGESEKPDDLNPRSYTVEHHADDLRALADALGIGAFGLVVHDVGSLVAQALARAYPERLTGIFFFDCAYPGIAERWNDPDHMIEVWYQQFHQLSLAPKLVGSSRQACEAYIRHFLDHWAHRPGSFEEADVAAWVDNFLKPGNLQGGFNWYIHNFPRRLEAIKSGPPKLPLIETPCRFRWGVSDKVLKVEWADRLGDYFADYDFAPFPEAGHYPMYEKPEAAAAEIRAFFDSLPR
jgi:pimeloyl-ACP methyl ester carboxylesterase